MTEFRKALRERLSGRKARRLWVFVAYDQLTDAVGPLSREDPSEVGIILIENPWKAARRPYHRQKLALVIANMRRFALEQAARGVAVQHLVANGPYRDAFPPLVGTTGPVQVMRPAEYELRADLKPLMESGVLVEVPHQGWLTSRDVLIDSHPGGPPYLLERFYRAARRKYDVLMDGKEPVGGKYNFDAENRHPWRPDDPEPPAIPRFAVDPIKQEVGELIEQRFSGHPGRLDLETLPTTREDAGRVWQWAKQNCLTHFGRYEDAMTTRSSSLFHTRISALLNICRLTPKQVVGDVERLDIPVASKEGFIRQVLGWREFMHHIHEVTEGFRTIPSGSSVEVHSGEGGASPSFLGASAPLPPAFWGKRSGLECLDAVVKNVWEEGWSHHITRLMVLSNLATLLDVSPRELTDWFWVAYTDAYDWVVEPNVLGLGTFAVGQLFTTKPYISGANYIHRMSDYCEACRFDPRKDCPFIPLYWAFLERHRDVLENNPRLANVYMALRKRHQISVRQDQEAFVQIRDRLLRGEELGQAGGATI